MRTHYGPWQPCWISNQHKKHKSGRGPSNEHFWQVWFNSVQWFQRRRFKCEKLTNGRWTLTHDKSLHGLWPGELKNVSKEHLKIPKSAKEVFRSCRLRKLSKGLNILYEKGPLYCSLVIRVMKLSRVRTGFFSL